MQNNFELEHNYVLKSDLDGFYSLYYQGKEVYQVHDDAISRSQQEDNWEYESSADEYMHRLFIVVGMYESY